MYDTTNKSDKAYIDVDSFVTTKGDTLEIMEIICNSFSPVKLTFYGVN